MDDLQGITPAISTWNLYHFSAGSNIKFLKHNFTVGLTYSKGKESGGTQLVNLGAPSTDEIFKPTESGTEVNYDQVQLTIGYVYNIQ